eukprot:1443702-Heterocapsa_arctica.AAC.1
MDSGFQGPGGDAHRVNLESDHDTARFHNNNFGFGGFDPYHYENWLYAHSHRVKSASGQWRHECRRHGGHRLAG